MIELTKKTIKGADIIVTRRNGKIGKELTDDQKNHVNSRFKNDDNGIVTFPEAKSITICTWYDSEKQNSKGELYDAARKAGGEVVKVLKENRIEGAQITAVKGVEKEEVLAFLEGMILQDYEFLNYKSKKNPSTLKKVGVEIKGITDTDLKELTGTMKGVYLARDLVNEPVITLNAEELSNRITAAGKDAGFKVKVLNKKEIEKHNMGGLMGVNLGSIDPPTFNIMEYKPKNAKNKKPIVLVGKGIVYDTGGNNIKISGFMSNMKSDMGGAAAVSGIIYAAAKNELPVHVVGLIPATDNRIDKNALVPDDVITISDGTTVEIQNTDAEGRLVLADALVYAKKYDPELVLDFATLTGAAAAVTGSFGLAMMGTAGANQKRQILESGDLVYERCAEFPFWKEYSDLLKSEIADIKNIGGPVGGGTTAGKFLQHFTDYPWVHFDIAGPAFITKAEPYKPVGGTGAGVRLIYQFLKSL